MTNEEAIKYLKQLYPHGGCCWLDEQRIEAISLAVSALQTDADFAKRLDDAYRNGHRVGYAKRTNEINRAYVRGAAEMKEKMMKDAVDATKIFSGIGSNSKTGECVPYTEYKICISDKLCDGCSKIKLIIVKED